MIHESQNDYHRSHSQTHAMKKHEISRLTAFKCNFCVGVDASLVFGGKLKAKKIMIESDS
jgi:hypothetical protein